MREFVKEWEYEIEIQLIKFIEAVIKKPNHLQVVYISLEKHKICDTSDGTDKAKKFIEMVLYNNIKDFNETRCKIELAYNNVIMCMLTPDFKKIWDELNIHTEEIK